MSKNEMINNQISCPKLRSITEIASLFSEPGNPSILKQFSATGFAQLDDALGGGISPGLTILGAPSSLGKSTFVLQVAGNMAKSGSDVIFASLEMPKLDIAAKLISLHTYVDHGQNTHLAKTATELRSDIADRLDPEELEAIQHSVSVVMTQSQNLYVLDNQKPVTLAKIEEYLKEHLNQHPSAKIVLIVDYLQLLAQVDSKSSASDKQALDNCLMQLRNMSTQYNIPIILVSSYNRSGYSTAASMQSYKDSGLIEYSADVLLALQLRGIDNKHFDLQRALSANPRQVELVILKQRYNAVGQSIAFDFFPKYNYFQAQINDNVREMIPKF